MVDHKLLDRIDGIRLSERLERLRERYFSETPRVCGERAKLISKVWRETQGDPIEIRRAKLIKRVLEEFPTFIFDDELTVGSWGKYFRAANPSIDWDAEYFPQVKVDEGVVTFGGPAERGFFTKEDWEACLEAMAAFKGETAAEKVREFRRLIWGDWYEDLVEARGTLRFEAIPVIPARPKWETILEKGLKGIIEEAKERLRLLKELKEDDPEKLYFLEAVITSLEGVITFARRYAQAARQKAREVEDPRRKAELEEIAGLCERVPENPPTSFREALQAYRLLLTSLFLEQTTFACWAGRIDQWLYPYFRRDLEEGRISLEEAAELVGDIVTFEARLQHIRHLHWREFVQATMVRSYTLGGLTRDGKDACNELTYLFLHMMGLLRYAEPHISFRWHPEVPERFMKKCAEVNCQILGGIPMYLNDVHIVRYLTDRAIPAENARDYCILGCSQPIADPQPHQCQPVYSNATLALDLALHNGVSPVTGKRIGIETGDPRGFRSFEEVYEAWKKQYEFIARRLLWHSRFAWNILLQYWRTPLLSAFIPGCIEDGKNYLVGGGGRPYIHYFKDRSFINVADSLMAIKKLVFERRLLTMEELLEALDSNFAGPRGEEIRQMCLAAPKFGNDTDEVDYLARDCAKFSASICFSEKCAPSDNPYMINRNGVAWHYYAGMGIGALPDGRKAREPLADGSLSPMTGRDKNGPTAVVRSVLKADFTDAAVSILNMKFPIGLFQTPENFDKFIAFTKAFLKSGGIHIQYNIFDRNVLLEAKKNPEKYKDLVVRVAGYSAYFVNLTPEVQDEIIARTEQWL